MAPNRIIPNLAEKDPSKIKGGLATAESKKRKRREDGRDESPAGPANIIKEFVLIGEDGTTHSLSYAQPNEAHTKQLWDTLQLDVNGIRRDIIDHSFGSTFTSEDLAQLSLKSASYLVPTLVNHHLDLRLRAPKGPIAYVGQINEKTLRKISKAADREAEYYKSLPKIPEDEQENNDELKKHDELMGGLLKVVAPMSVQEANDYMNGWLGYQIKVSERFRRELSMMALQLNKYSNELAERESRLGAVGSYIASALKEAAPISSEQPTMRLSPIFLTAIRPDLHRCTCAKCGGCSIQSTDDIPEVLLGQIRTRATEEAEGQLFAKVSEIFEAEIRSVDDISSSLTRIRDKADQEGRDGALAEINTARAQAEKDGMDRTIEDIDHTFKSQFQLIEHIPSHIRTSIQSIAIKKVEDILSVLPWYTATIANEQHVNYMMEVWDSAIHRYDYNDQIEEYEEQTRVWMWEAHYLWKDGMAERNAFIHPDSIERRRTQARLDFIFAPKECKNIWEEMDENDPRRKAADADRAEQMEAWDEQLKEKALNYPLRTDQEWSRLRLGKKIMRYRTGLDELETENLEKVRKMLLEESQRRQTLDPPQVVDIPRTFIEPTEAQLAEFEAEWGPPPMAETRWTPRQRRSRQLCLEDRRKAEEEAQANGLTAVEAYVEYEKTEGARLADETAAEQNKERLEWGATMAAIVSRQRRYYIVNEVRKHYEELLYHYDHSRGTKINFPAAIDTLVNEFGKSYRAVHPEEGSKAATKQPLMSEIKDWVAAELAKIRNELEDEFHAIRNGNALRYHDLPSWHMEFTASPGN
jgi:hypothetical protein